MGHSTLSIDEFVRALKSAGVALVVDVRTVPRSRTNPQFDREALPRSLSEFEMGYAHIPALGGLQVRRGDVPPEVNAFWQNESFHHYADYAMGDAFARVSLGCSSSAASGALRLCARKRCGGGAIAGSSRTTSWRRAKRSFTSSARRSKRRA